MSIPTQIERLLAANQIQKVEMPDQGVATLWEKAVLSLRDARNASNSLDSRYVIGYQALLQMATAVLAAAGYRTIGTQGHHANTFYAVSALGIDGLESLGRRMDDIRRTRAQTAYGASSPRAGDLEQLFALIRSVFPPARAWLAARRPGARLVAFDG